MRPAHGSHLRPYLLLASQSTVSGFFVDGFHVPLADDWLFSLAANGGLASIVRGGAGVLDAAGRAGAAVTLPPLGPAGVGLQFYVGAVVIDAARVVHVSNPQILSVQ